jgi:hypothetical protein
MSSREPIEDYLDDLFLALTGSPREVRRTLVEVEEHLIDSAAAHRARGLAPMEAERAAVADFGPVESVARDFDRRSWRDLVRPLTLLAAVGLVAVGLSGAIAEVMGRVWGASFVAGDLPGTTYTPARCAYFQEYFPSGSCLDSAAQHHWGEVVQYRVAAGVLGLLLLVVWRLLPKRRPLPRGILTTTAVCVFGLATLVLAGETLNASGSTAYGAGQWLSGAVVAAGVTAGAGLWMVRDLRLSRLRRAAG